MSSDFVPDPGRALVVDERAGLQLPEVGGAQRLHDEVETRRVSLRLPRSCIRSFILLLQLKVQSMDTRGTYVIYTWNIRGIHVAYTCYTHCIHVVYTRCTRWVFVHNGGERRHS